MRVWSTDAIYNAADPKYNKPRQLASMSYHSGTIHTVRFSGNGQYLASGADDKIVCIYKLDPNPPPHNPSFGMYKSRAMRGMADSEIQDQMSHLRSNIGGSSDG